MPATEEPMLMYRTNPTIDTKDAIIAYSMAVAAELSVRRDGATGRSGSGLGMGSTMAPQDLMVD
jgi:hypothetical protein